MTKYIFVLLGLFSSTLLFPQSVSEVAAVQLSAVASASPVRITVSWKSLSGTNSITIYRKLKSATSWGSSIASPSPTTNSYIDNGVSVGIAYEYKVVRVANGVTGTGYLCSGINVPMRDYRGKIILLVANNLSSPLSTELLTLEKDLAADGWAVLRTDVTTNTTVSGVRNIIIGQYQSDPTNVKAVYIVGHLAVPYSGNIAPDGHDSHQGAWPCDGYYGEMNGNWTDNSVSVQASQNPKNFNVPGDGKFDQSDFPSALELQVGRVDLYDMPAFSSSEVELTRNYLNKAHTFKVKGYTPDPRAMMFDNLQWVGNPLAASGWRSIAPMVGAEEISAPYQYGPSYNSLVNGQSYLWAYASGGGLQEYIGNEVTFNGADNIGTTQTYAAGNLGGVFNMSFGSYFGDWDNKNNFLRAPLAKGEGLTNAYSSIPGWYFHHMGLGENIGYSTLETMNNTGLYVPLTDGWQGSIGRTHLGLMGDPSLRQKMVAPPTSLSISNSGGSAVFSWTASSEQIAGYYIYQFDATTGAISKVTNTLVTSTSYQNSSVPFQNGKQYMVRAMKMQVDPSGSYENLSLGTIAVSSGVAPPPTTDCEGVVGGTAVAGTTCNDGNSCTTNDRWNSSCQCIGIDNTPTASVTPVGSTTFCTGGNVVLNASTGSSYQWKKDGNAISGATSSSYTATTSGTYTVTVSNGSCSATSSGVSVSASSGPSANITAPNGTTFCSGGSAILNATTGTGFQYVWYRDGSVISGATNGSYTATQAGAYTVRVISGACYTNSSAITVSITTSGTASITPVGSTSFCTGGNVVLNASTGSSYQWKKDGNAISGATSSSYTATTSGTYTVTVSNGSCSATSSGVSVSASSGPSANITAPNGTTFCSGGSAILNATTGTGFQYVWYRNGNAISGATNSNYTATQAGAYTVRVISGTCYTNSSAISIEVSTSITAVITPNGPTTFCTGGSVVLNATSDGTHVWQFNGQAIPGATSSSYTATQQGSYKVIVTNGSCSATSDAVTVSISTSAPAATLSASGPVNLCVGSSVVLSAPPGSSYVWEHNNEAINGATNSNYTVTQGGSYSVTVGTGACASTSDPLNVTVNTPPPAIISATGPTTVCAGQSVALTANTGSGYQFVWKRNGSPISGATSSSYTATQPGNYAVMVIHGACYTNSAETAISMSGTGSASISPAGPTTFCTGGNVILNANAGSIYQWMRNGETIDGATSSNYTATQEGSYTVTVGSGSCAGTSSPLMVSVSSVISASITPAGPTTFCTGGNVVLNANAGSIYQWMRNGETIDGATSSNYSATQEGSYTVTVGSGSCTGTSSAVTVSVTSIGSATIAPGGSTSFCTGGSVILYANTGAGYSYVWRKNGTVINGATASNYTATEVGSYTVAVNAGTCSATSSAIIVTVTNNISATLFATGPVGFCYGGSVVLAVDGDAGYTYVWKLNGSTIQGATSNSFTGTQAGIYTVVVSNGNCSATSNSVQLHVGDQINTNITATQQTDLCSNGGVTLSVPAASGNTYIWRNYGAAINGATSNTYTAASSGGYEVSIYNGSCVANSNVVFVNAGSGVNTWIMALGNTHVCSGDEVVFSTYTLAGLSHTWRRNGATINGATGSTYTATQNGSYSVTTSNGSCTVTTNAIQAYISAPLAVTCSPNVGNGTIAANVTGGEAPYNYLWNTAPAQITQMAAIDVSGMYNVIVTDVNGCTVNANASIEIGSGMAVEETEDVLAETIVKDEASENIEILVYPNPFRGNTTFSITGLNAEERTTLDVYTIDGVLVANVFTGAVDQQGSYRLTWDASNLKTGMYFYRLISGGRVTSGKLKSE